MAVHGCGWVWWLWAVDVDGCGWSEAGLTYRCETQTERSVFEQ